MPNITGVEVATASNVRIWFFFRYYLFGRLSLIITFYENENEDKDGR